MALALSLCLCAPAVATENSPPGGIAVPAAGTEGPAGQYPSSIQVSGYTGTITRVTVSLDG